MKNSKTTLSVGSITETNRNTNPNNGESKMTRQERRKIEREGLKLISSSEPRPITERIRGVHIKPKLTNPNKIIWRKYIKDLPEEIRDKVQNHFHKIKIVERCCWYNSHLLSILNDEIEVVNGWYGTRITKKSPHYHYLKTLKSSGELVYLYDGNEVVSMFDKKRMIGYRKHSWNKYKNYHFCVTTELDTEEKGTFFYLNEQEIIKGKSLTCNPTTREKYYHTCVSRLKSGIRDGLRVVNNRFLNKPV
jgi:hypothetical protein